MGTTLGPAREGAPASQTPVGAVEKPCPCSLRLHLHVDADRDGVVDDDWTQNGVWEAGPGKRGAIILCNCDRDGALGEDNKNNKVDGAADESDIAPLVIRKHPKGLAAPAGWKAVLEVPEEAKETVRIFDKPTANGAEILGGKTHKLEIASLDRDEWRYGMEATQYPGRMKRARGGSRRVLPTGVGEQGDAWDGRVALKLSLLDGQGNVVHAEEAHVRVAPWVKLNHFDPVEVVYVVKRDDNDGLRADLGHAIGVKLEEWDHTSDRWTRDVMAVGFSTLPMPKGAPDPHVPVAVRTPMDRVNSLGVGLDRLVKRSILGPGYGYYETSNPVKNVSDLNSFGNLECSPPFEHPKTKRDYKFGRLVIGTGSPPLDEALRVLREFLYEQKVQHPFDIDVGWLKVGHVDEILSFVPFPTAPKKFKVILASAGLAITILEQARKEAPGAPLFQGIRGFSDEIRAEYKEQTVEAVLGAKGDRDFVKVAEEADKKLAAARRTLVDELGLGPDEIIEFPVLFAKMEGKFVFYTADSVNMLVVTQGCTTREGARTVKLAIPKPFGPVVGGKCRFEADIEAKLLKDGLRRGDAYEFVDDFVSYHHYQGEIHCGTNSKHRPPTDRFWWEQDGI